MSEPESAPAQSAAPERPARSEGVINVFINDERFEAPAPEMTGAQLLELAGVPAGNQLFLDVPGPGDDRPIGADEVVMLRSGLRFYDVPAGNFG